MPHIDDGPIHTCSDICQRPECVASREEWREVAKKFQDQEDGFIDSRLMAEEILRLRKQYQIDCADLATKDREIQELKALYATKMNIAFNKELIAWAVYSDKLREALEKADELYASDMARTGVIRTALALPRPGGK